MHRVIGYFDDEIVAAKAYDATAKKHHGEFAVLNFTGLAKKKCNTKSKIN